VYEHADQRPPKLVGHRVIASCAGRVDTGAHLVRAFDELSDFGRRSSGAIDVSVAGTGLCMERLLR
jgi:hypothetical protein